MKNFKYPLQNDPFTYKDRLKIASFILNKKSRFTMGEKVKELEAKMMAKYEVNCLAVSSGSAANHLIFELWKQKNPSKFKNSLVIVPSTTWISSVSPALMSGYKIEFCDVNLQDFCFNYEMLGEILEKNKKKNCIIWPTALIGFCPDFSILKRLANVYKAELWLDSCENLHSRYKYKSLFAAVNIASLSGYWAHQLNGIEIGFVFIKDAQTYDYAKTLRNHGLVRSLHSLNTIRKRAEYEYPNIDPQFLFTSMGTNWRTSDLHAMFALQDFDRIDENKRHSKLITKYFYENLNRYHYYLPDLWDNCSSTLKVAEHVLFCLPIFRYDNKMEKIKKFLNSNGWETRPIISYLPIQPPFKQYKDKEFKNSQWIHDHGCYVGLNSNLKEKDVDKLVKMLN